MCRGTAVTTVGMRSIKEVSGGTLDTDAAQAGAAITGSPLESPSTLVIYTYSKSDPEYERNLDFFVAHGMWEGDGCHYLIIVQQVGGLGSLQQQRLLCLAGQELGTLHAVLGTPVPRP